jgi:hypothetical protein
MLNLLPTFGTQRNGIMRIVGLGLLCFAFSVGQAQTGSEIWLFDLKIKKDALEIRNGKNITQHPGYDNQPFFHTDLPLLYYSSFNEEGRADIKSYNFDTNETLFITKTHEREYSPTLTPDKSSLSCIIQRDNNAQDLGKYPVEGGEATVIIDNLVVGYHVWADNSHLALFVLGRPNTLHYLRLPTKEDTIVARNIGRSLHKIPGERAISFVHKISESDWQIKKLDTESMKISAIASTLPGREDIAWTHDKKIVSSDGVKLFFLSSRNPSGWKEVKVIGNTATLKGITRLAVSARGNKLAVVVAE